MLRVLSDRLLGDNEIEELVTFAHKLNLAIGEADLDLEARQRIVELLDVHGVLAVEDGEKVIYVSFKLTREKKPERLSVSNWPKLEKSLSVAPSTISGTIYLKNGCASTWRPGR